MQDSTAGFQAVRFGLCSGDVTQWCVVAWLQDAFLDKHGVKLGFMSAFVKASADALQVLKIPVIMLKLTSIITSRSEG